MNAPFTSQSLVPNAVAEITTALRTNFGLPDLHAEMFSLAVICAITGYVRGIIDPAGGRLTASIQLVAHGKRQVILQRALRSAFNPVQEVQGARYMETMLKGEDDARTQMMDVQAQMRRCQATVAKIDVELNPTSTGFGPDFPDPEDLLRFNQVANPGLLRQRQGLVQQIEELTQKLRQLAISRSPVVMVEGMAPDEVRALSRCSLDGTLFNLDSRGTSLQQMLLLGSRHRREICGATAAALDYVTVRPENPRRVPLGHAGASVVSSYVAAKLMRDKEVRATGLGDHMIFLRLDETPGLEGAAEMPGEDSLTGVLAKELMALRSENKSTVMELSVEAQVLYWAFQRQIERAAINEADEFQGRISLLPQLALKFALLYHIGAGGLEVGQISAATFEKARELSWRLYEHQKTALQVSPGDAMSDDCMDVEVFKLVAKIRNMDGPTKREIARSCHDQVYDRLEPLLLKAEADGWIREMDGRFVALKVVSETA